MAVDPLDRRAARVAALDALARRDHASLDLRRKLIDKGYDPAMVGELIERLGAEKLVDDGRFVENFIRLHAARGQGPNRVRAALDELGLTGERVEAALAAYGDWIAALDRARCKRFGAETPVNTADLKRQAGFLGYRGFTDAQIRAVLGWDTEFEQDSEL